MYKLYEILHMNQINCCGFDNAIGYSYVYIIQFWVKLFPIANSIKTGRQFTSPNVQL